jgi:hypothetical protein
MADATDGADGMFGTRGSFSFLLGLRERMQPRCPASAGMSAPAAVGRRALAAFLASRRFSSIQANLQGVNFGRRSPNSGGQNCTPNDSERIGMRGDEIGDMNIIPDAGAIRRRVVGAEDIHFRPPPERMNVALGGTDQSNPVVRLSSTTTWSPASRRA